MRILERSIESTVVAWARRQGVMVTKLQGLGNRSWPDRIFWIPGGRPCLIEFKRPGGKLTPLQAECIGKLAGCGYSVSVCDSADAAKAFIFACIDKVKL